MKRFAIFCVSFAIFSSFALLAQEERHLFQNAFEAIDHKETIFQPGGNWFPYPTYTDRKGWDQIMGKHKDEVIRYAESFLDYTWQVVPASIYLSYEKKADRTLYRPLNENTEALLGSILGELAEGKGRFLLQIINGMYYFANMPSWNGSGSEVRDNLRKRMLPDPDYCLIALTSASRAALIATGLFFFQEEFDKIDPLISKVVYKALESHTFEPYLDEFHENHGHEWMGFNRPRANNWNTYCNTFVLQAFLLADRDPERLLRALARCARSIDRYLDTNKMDGACDEGPSYWSMAGGKLFEYTAIMKACSRGLIDLFPDPQIRRMMEWRSKCYITDGWVVPFGDGSARNSGDGPLLFRIGTTIESPELTDLAIYLAADPKQNVFDNTPSLSHDIFRILETLRYAPLFEEAQEAALTAAGGNWDRMMMDLRSSVGSYWYEQTEHAFLRSDKAWFVAAKGGNNGESHNHNDVGSGLLFIEDIPVIIDPGVATYLHSPLVKVDYWNLKSDWHNLPTINGVQQGTGARYKASGTSCDVKRNLFTTDLSLAYPDSAHIRHWKRSWSLKDDKLVITDQYTLSARTQPTFENFVTQGPIYLEGENVDGYTVKKGEAIIATHNHSNSKRVLIKMVFPKELIPHKDKRELDDPRFIKNWGSHLYRLQLEVPQNSPLSCTHVFLFKRMTVSYPK